MTPPREEPLLTTVEIAELLQLRPKQVYRLVRQGLPGRRVGGEWRFLRREVMAWVERGGSEPSPSAAPPAVGAPAPLVERTAPSVGRAAPSVGRSAPSVDEAAAPFDRAALPEGAAPLVAANGDVAVEQLLALVNAGSGPRLGFLQADRDQALDLLRRGAVLAAGSHGTGPPARLGGVRLARLHLVRREVGLVGPRGRPAPRLAALPRLSFAARPPSAGITTHLEAAARRARLDLDRLLARATPHDSHREVVCAVLRGDADAGLATRAWAHRVGLPFRKLADESYGLLVRALDLGDPRVVRLCEVAQGRAFRRLLAATPGYDASDAGLIRYDDDPAA